MGSVGCKLWFGAEIDKIASARRADERGVRAPASGERNHWRPPATASATPLTTDRLLDRPLAPLNPGISGISGLLVNVGRVDGR